jgi:nucleotide-binding universal stress UspA family protein
MSSTYTKILLTLDGSELALLALPHARAMAQSFSAELILLQVIEDLTAKQLHYVPSELLVDVERYSAKQLQSAVEDAQQELDALVAQLHAESIPARSIVKVGEAAATIIDFAATENVDLIVMSTHGRTGLARWVYGSVAEKVSQAAPCPTLLIRPPKP